LSNYSQLPFSSLSSAGLLFPPLPTTSALTARKAQAYLLAQQQTAAPRGEEAKIERMEEAEGATLAAAKAAKPQRDEQAYQSYRAGERDAEAIVKDYETRKAVQAGDGGICFSTSRLHGGECREAQALVEAGRGVGAAGNYSACTTTQAKP